MENSPIKIDIPLICTDNYRIHGRGIRIRTNNPNISKTLKNLLGHFSVPEIEPQENCATFFLYSAKNFDEISAPLLPRSSKPISFSGDNLYFMEENRLYTILPGKTAVMCDFSQMEVHGVITEPLSSDSWIVFQLFFSPSFLEILKKLGFYNLHASTVCLKDKGIFFSATTGSGKSTLAICLVRSGFGFLSDDITFAYRNSSNIELLAFPQPTQMWDDALQRFPELHQIQPQRARCQGHKKQFRVEEIYPGSIRNKARAKVVIFPKIVNQEKSHLQEVSKTKALIELIPQSLMVAQRSIVKDHLDILSDLIDQCDCYKLFFGSDLDHIPELISGVL